MTITTDDADAEAMHRCQRGDITGLEALVRRYQLAAVRMAYLLMQDRALAEDIVQESFLLAYLASPRFRLDAPFAPWFYRIVLNTARQQQRAQRRRHEVSLDATLMAGRAIETEPVAPDPFGGVERAEERAAILDALGDMPDKQREVLILRYYCGYKDKDIATILGCPGGTVRWRLHTALRTLERLLRERYPWLTTDCLTANDEVRENAPAPIHLLHVEGEIQP